MNEAIKAFHKARRAAIEQYLRACMAELRSYR